MQEQTQSVSQKNQTKTQTLKIIGMLQLAYGNSLDEIRLRFYVEMLKDIPTVILESAVNYCIQHCKFLPTIAEIREVAEKAKSLAAGTKPMDANDAWGIVQKAIDAIGMYEKPTFESPIIQRVVDRMGWKDICLTPVENTSTLRAQFRRAYEDAVKNEQGIQDYQRAGVPVHQRYLQLNQRIQNIIGTHSMKPEQIEQSKEE